MEVPVPAPAYVIPFRELTLGSLAQVGGKNASLGEVVVSLGPRGVAIPDGSAVTAAAFHRHLTEAGLDRTIYPELDRLDLSNLEALSATARSIRERIASASAWRRCSPIAR
jgi:pyruvate,water dikinase